MRIESATRRLALWVLLPALVAACGAGVRAARQKDGPPAPAAAEVPQKKKNAPFTEEELKEGKIEGSWSLDPVLDQSQLNSNSFPVTVTGLNVVSGDSEGPFAGLMKVNTAEIENGGEKATRSIQLKWALGRREGGVKILAEGVTAFFDARIPAGESQTADIPPIFFNRIAKPLLEGGELNGDFILVVGVSEVRFEDGSVWRRDSIDN